MPRIVAASLRLETPQSVVKPVSGTQAAAARRRRIRYGLLGFNAALLLTVGFLVVRSMTPGDETRTSASAVSALARKDSMAANPLDRLSSADIAVNVARVANLPQTVAVTNQADSENAQLAVAQTSDSLVSKPQVISTAYKSNKDIQVYEAKAGDTAASIAAQFHVTTDTILWSNDLPNNNVTPGTKLHVLPGVNGVIYVVKGGDTPDSLAEKYRTTKEKIIRYNDAETGGLKPGERIIVPDGQILKVQPAVASYGGGGGGYGSSFPWGGAGPLYGSNGYVPGYCTWYVANKIRVPSNWGNANTWDNLAPRSGWTVSTVPRVGAIGQTDRGAEGHVAVIEAVSPDGTMIKYSDMNGLAGYNAVGRTADWVSAAKFEHYIFQ